MSQQRRGIERSDCRFVGGEVGPAESYAQIHHGSKPDVVVPQFCNYDAFMLQIAGIRFC